VADLRGRWGEGALQLGELRASRGRSRLRLSGSVGKTLSLAGSWRLEPAELPLDRPLPDWVLAAPLEGTVRAAGTPADPQVAVTTGQPSHPLLGAWQASLAWGGRALRLDRFTSPHLRASGRIPLVRRPGRGLAWGELDARLQLEAFPLERLEPVVGTPLTGSIDLDGSLRGPLASLRPDFALTVRQPGAGPLWLRESWSGRLAGVAGGGARLGLSSLAPAVPGRIDAFLDADWLPVKVEMRRREGSLALVGRPAGYRWSARGFPLAGLSLVLGPKRAVEPLEGDLSGAGSLSLQPLAFAGEVDLERPRFLGLGGRRIAAKVSYRDRAYRVEGEVEPLSAGRIEIAARGTWQGPVQAEVSARGLDTVLLRQLAALVPRFRGEGEVPSALADAAALGSLAIDPPPGSLIDQLAALRDAVDVQARRDAELAAAGPAERLARLQIGIDADLKVSGPDLRRARATLEATGHIWKGYPELSRELTDQPFEVRLEGPLGTGEGTFAITGLSLALLALVGPLPPDVSGRLALQGRYRLGAGRPQLSVELALEDAALAGRPLRLERGRIDLEGDRLALDLALRAEGATSSVDLSGTVPLDPQQEGLRLRLASRDDGIRFLAALAGPRFDWREGSADLQLLVRGSLQDPIANGFLRIGDGRFDVIGQTLEDVQATVLFDFQQMLLQELTARVGKAGRITGEGAIGLLRPLGPRQGLAVKLAEVPFSVPRITAVGNGQLRLLGSLASPRLGGEVTVSDGTINATRGSLADAPPESDQPATPASINELREARWDFQEPLVLLGPDVESDTGASLRDAVPKVGWLAFDGLTVDLGPDLRVVMPNVATFRTGGRLRISGRLDPSLRASGVVRLLGGRLNLFTTTFTLDPSAPNVAIFTPSLGLVPYLDVALRTRISDSLGSFDDDASPVVGWGSGAGSGAPSVAELQQVESFSSLGQLQLILVTVSVSGPADRIADNLELRSSPPLPRDRLIALIGGNTLAGLTGGAAGTALATAVGQTLLSPVLSSLTDALGQRVSLAIYPTYVSPEVEDRREYSTEKVPPQLVLGTEVGVDVTPRLNASVLAAPNRTDVPPQFNFSWKASDVFTLRGGVDTQGAWQSQLQVFLRF
jgi:translocation and assembly module TamB